MNTDLPSPKLDISDSAFQQILLMQRHDYTLNGMSFRIKIGGKGCDGFTYETGFSVKQADDVVVRHSALSLDTKQTEEIEILMDPFTAFYTQVARLDHAINTETQEEGFLLTNHNQALHRGKFYKDTSMVPPWEKA